MALGTRLLRSIRRSFRRSPTRRYSFQTDTLRNDSTVPNAPPERQAQSRPNEATSSSTRHGGSSSSRTIENLSILLADALREKNDLQTRLNDVTAELASERLELERVTKETDEARRADLALVLGLVEDRQRELAKKSAFLRRRQDASKDPQLNALNLLAQRMTNFPSRQPSSASMVIIQESGTCSICQDHPIDAACQPCGHTGCEACFTSWAEQSDQCPFCRQEVDEVVRIRI